MCVKCFSKLRDLMTGPSPLRWGIASAGLISHDFTNAVVGVLPEDQHRVVAVAARRKEDAETFALKHNIPRSYGDYAELAEDPDVDVRMFAGPLFLYFQQIFFPLQKI